MRETTETTETTEAARAASAAWAASAASFSEAFYLPLDGPQQNGEDGDVLVERFHATASTVGPWFPNAQHLGPPSALLVRAFEQRPGELRLARYTVEILGVVPDGEVTVRSWVERPGRSIELLAAEMTAKDRPVLRARAWRLAVTDTAAVAGGAAPSLPGPAEARPHDGPAEGWLEGYINAMEWRWLQGALTEVGPGTAWTRPLVPVVEGEKPSPLQCLAAAADSANGIAAPLDLREWLFVNTELTVHLHRPPVGEWTGIDAETVIGPTGTGTVSARLFDLDGHVGRISQELTVRPRR